MEVDLVVMVLTLLNLAILPCSRHSCSYSLSFTVDANDLFIPGRFPQK